MRWALHPRWGGGSRARVGARGSRRHGGAPPDGARKQLEMVAGKALGHSEGAAGASWEGCTEGQCWQERQRDGSEGRKEGRW